MDIQNIKDNDKVEILCIQPTKTLEKNKIYIATKITHSVGCFYKPFDYREAFVIKLNEFFSVTVSPKRFKILKIIK